MSEVDENAILGETEAVTAEVTPDEAAILGETQTVEQAQPEQQQQQETEPTLPAGVDQAEVGRAFAAQREALMAKHQAEVELARHQERQRVLSELQQQQAQQQAQPEEMPDPIVDPEGFQAWDARRLQAIQHQYDGRLQQMAVQTSIQMAQMTANLQKESLGFDWQGALAKADAEIGTIAPLMGVSPEAYRQHLLASPDAGERILALAQANAGRTATAAPVDMEAVKKEAYEQAFKDLQAKAAASPHSLAPRGLPPGTSIAPVKQLSEDEILAQ